MPEAERPKGQAAQQAQPSGSEATSLSSAPHLQTTEFSITASGPAIYVTFGSSRVVIGAEGPRGLGGKEWFQTIVMSPESFQQFVAAAQQTMEAYKKQWGSPPELPINEPRREESR